MPLRPYLKHAPRALVLVLSLLIAVRLSTPFWLSVHVDTPLLLDCRSSGTRTWHDRPGQQRISLTTTAQTNAREGPVTIRGYELARPHPVAYMLYFGGRGGSVQGDAFERWLRDSAKVNLTGFDYRGCGLSGGRGSVAGIWSDALAEYDLTSARAQKAHVPVIVYGQSLGTELASYVATHRKPAGVVLHSPVHDAATQIAYMQRDRAFMMALTGLHPQIDPDVRTFLDNATRARQLTEPLLVLHGTRDGFVPFAGGSALFDAAPSPNKRFVAMPNLDHGNWIGGTIGGNAVIAFVRAIANP